MKQLLVLFLLVLATGCSLEASLESLAENTIKFMDPAKTTGLVSGSTQSGTASGNGVTYQVQSSIGNYMSGIEQTTSDKSYKIYSSIQGALVSQ